MFMYINVASRQIVNILESLNEFKEILFLNKNK